ncbi:MAG: GNAT family N-acetyltransferase [Flavobacteriales bacterium]|nr:GNAT family N-acetyltransferase [Flavobacteriales bacterium]|tara:strand:- start:912 stop:1430 length:519 start_codon:yes stop_codon:yes gene_type:complete
MLPITHDRLSLRLFEEADISDDYIAWLNDPEVVQFSNQRFLTHDRESCKAYLDSFLNSDNIFLLITHNESEEAVGTMTVYFSKNHQTADIGIIIGNKDFWGMGLGEEAWRTVMDFLLEKLDIRKVTGGALSCNKGMVRIFEKVGMVPDGIRKDHEMIDGKPYDILHFAKFMS